MSKIADALRKAKQEQMTADGSETGIGHDEAAPDTTAEIQAPWVFDDLPRAALPPAGGAGLGTPGSGGGAFLPRRRSARSAPPSASRRQAPGAVVMPDIGPPVQVIDGGSRAPMLAAPEMTRYWDVIRRRWPTAALIAIVVVTGVSAGLLLRDPVYRATGLLEIRRESTSAVAVETLFGDERIAADDLETQFGILRSSSLAERVVAQLGAQASAGSTAAAPEWAALAQSLTPDKLRRGLIINPQRGSRLVELSFDSRHPEFSALVVNSALDTYLQLRMEEAQDRAEWLEAELRGMQETLEASERRLQEHVRQHGLEVLETGRGEAAQLVNDRLRSLQQSLASVQGERIARQSEVEMARQEMQTGGLDSPVVQNLSVSLTDLRREYAKLAPVYHDEYPPVQALKTQIASLEHALDEQHALVLDRMERSYQAAVRREGLLRQSLSQQTAIVEALSDSSGVYESLRRDVVTNQQLFASLNQKLKEVSISAALKATNVGVVDRANPPAGPHGSSPVSQVGLSIMVALVLAIGGVFVREYFDTSIRSAEDVDGYLGVPTLAAIPAVAPDRRALLPAGGSTRRQWRRIEADGSPSPLGEAFAALRTAVLLRDDEAAPRTILVTSAHSEEGKTTVSTNLALSLERLRYRVLLVDANMRHPCVREALTVEAGPGLVEYLTGERDWRACVRPGVRPSLDVMAGGTPNTSPVDLLSSPRMRALLAEAALEYDFVVLDSPALLASPADVRTLSTLVDNVLLTVRHGSTPREAVSFALSQLKDVIGVVLNRSDAGDILAFDTASPRPAGGATGMPVDGGARNGSSHMGLQREA